MTILFSKSSKVQKTKPLAVVPKATYLAILIFNWFLMDIVYFATETGRDEDNSENTICRLYLYRIFIYLQLWTHTPFIVISHFSLPFLTTLYHYLCITQNYKIWMYIHIYAYLYVQVYDGVTIPLLFILNIIHSRRVTYLILVPKWNNNFVNLFICGWLLIIKSRKISFPIVDAAQRNWTPNQQ